LYCSKLKPKNGQSESDTIRMTAELKNKPQINTDVHRLAMHDIRKSIV